MKLRLFLTLIIAAITFSVPIYGAENIDVAKAETLSPDSSEKELLEAGNEAYISGEYSKAIELYNAILAKDKESVELYFNLANSYYKSGNISKAIANYLRAERIAPSDKEIAYNLNYARQHTKNRIEEVPQFFLSSWMDNFSRTLNSNGWAVTSIIAFFLLFFAVLCYLLSTTVLRRKVSFSVAMFSLLLFIFSLSFSVKLKREIVNSKVAVVTSSAISVKSSPDNFGKDVFILNEGAEVEIVDKVGDWLEVEIASGNRGWVAATALEII